MANRFAFSTASIVFPVPAPPLTTTRRFFLNISNTLTCSFVRSNLASSSIFKLLEISGLIEKDFAKTFLKISSPFCPIGADIGSSSVQKYIQSSTHFLISAKFLFVPIKSAGISGLSNSLGSLISGKNTACPFVIFLPPNCFHSSVSKSFVRIEYFAFWACLIGSFIKLFCP
ncbi:hypothetical protein D3C74_259590 [compost metagenome]